MYRMKATRWIPPDSTPIEHPTGLGVAYAYNTKALNKPAAIAYAGKQSKASWHNSFASPDKRQERISEWFASLTSWELQKAKQRGERNEPHTLKPGDILHHSWGYEQTQCDYYQILSVTPHGATIQEIASETIPESTYSHGMADMRIPVKGAFHGEPFKVRINGYNSVAASDGRMSHGCCNLWNGQPNYCSWYA